MGKGPKWPTGPHFCFFACYRGDFRRFDAITTLVVV